MLAPSLPIVSEEAVEAFAAASGLVVFGPRSGSKTRNFAIPPTLPPGPLQRFLPLRVIEVSSLRPHVRIPLRGAVSGCAKRWRENVETRAEALAAFDDGAPALVGKDNYLYLAGWLDERALHELMALACRMAGLSTARLPEPVRLRRRGEFTFAFNYGAEPWVAPFGGEALLGGREVAPRGVSVWRD